MLTQEQRERLARLVLGACWEPWRVQSWLHGTARIMDLSSGELVLVGIASWIRTERPTDILVSDLAKLDERCRQRVVFALRLMFAGGASDWVDDRLAHKERQDAEYWREVAA